MKTVVYVIVVIMLIFSLTNPSVKSFKEYTPTYSELQNEITSKSFEYEAIRDKLEYKRIYNYLFFSIFEFQYTRAEKIRTESSGRVDNFGTYESLDKLIKRRYYGVLNNFFEIN